METCVFCRIAAGEIPATVLHADDELVAFRDINPQAPIHFLIIPREHVPSILDLDEAHDRLVGRILRLAASLARDLGIAETGFRVVANSGADAGQSVGHIHFHVLGGRSLAWPPG
ncbi:MAG: histidine triad nucleotide-binding protein [Firmicutes bacterium]|jgi:histidine triad (HIT) family protein|nr:histidine triad nucleotide-binding protein [Bacillota bacterium]